jgi:hypothetical protein
MVYFCIALLLVSLGLAAAPKTFSQIQEVKIINYSWYVDSEGYLDVVGLVQNEGPNTISSIAMTGSVLGPDNVDICDSGTQVWVSDLLPQQEAPFYMEFVAPQSSSQSSTAQVTWSEVIEAGEFSSISLSVASANATSSYQYQGLSITSSKGSVGTTAGYNGAYVVNGVIKNTGDQSATNLTVVGAFFNSTGSVVGVAYTDYLTPTVLVPGNTTTFEIAAFDLNQSQVPAALQIKSYQLLVQTGGPILQGAAPTIVPETTATTGPTDTPTSSPVASHEKANFSFLLPIGVAVAIAVIILVAVVSVVRQITSRKERQRQTVKEARKLKKEKNS